MADEANESEGAKESATGAIDKSEVEGDNETENEGKERNMLMGRKRGVGMRVTMTRVMGRCHECSQYDCCYHDYCKAFEASNSKSGDCPFTYYNNEPP